MVTDDGSDDTQSETLAHALRSLAGCSREVPSEETDSAARIRRTGKANYGFTDNPAAGTLAILVTGTDGSCTGRHGSVEFNHSKP